MLLLGSHTIDTGGIAMAVRRAGRARMSAMQLFTAIPKYYNEKVGVKPERAAAFRDALVEAGIAPSAVLAHAAYVLNVATPDEAKWTRASAGLAKELQRAEALGIMGVCFHPGAATDGDRGAAAQRIALAIAQALESVPGRARLLIENTAGAGSTVGRTPAEIAEMLAHVPDALRERTGYGLDTCHLFSSGYDLVSSREALVGVLDEFEDTTGERPAFFHLNDSEAERGSNRDRHALVGEGRIGVEPFRWLLHDRRTSGVPLLLETPQKHPDIAGDDATPDPWDVRMVTLLRELAE